MDDAIRFGLVLTMVLAVGTFFVIMIPLFRRNYRKAGMVGHETIGEGDELNTLRAEVEALRELPPRIAELEERLDFAERMLTQQREAERLPRGRDD